MKRSGVDLGLLNVHRAHPRMFGRNAELVMKELNSTVKNPRRDNFRGWILRQLNDAHLRDDRTQRRCHRIAFPQKQRVVHLPIEPGPQRFLKGAKLYEDSIVIDTCAFELDRHPPRMPVDGLAFRWRIGRAQAMRGLEVVT